VSEKIEITRVAAGGDGVGHIDGKVSFVPYGLPGDHVDIDIVKKEKNFMRGTIANISEPSPHRVTADCPVFEQCGGCTWLHFGYPGQAQWKQQIVQDSFKRIGRLDVDVTWVDDESLRTGYRTRATFRSVEGKWGFLEEKSHRVVPIDACPLLHPNLNAAVDKLQGVSMDASVEITVNPEGDDCLVWTKVPQPKLEERFGSCNAEQQEGELHGFLFDGTPIVNGCFSQSSLLLNRMLVNVVDRCIDTSESILDLYCGSGNFTLHYAKNSELVGIDQTIPAIEAAAQLAPNAYFPGDEAVMSSWIQNKAWDTIVLDPPRVGAKAIVDALAKCKASQIVYISCDPATLARDVRTLSESDWNVHSVTAVDMFPNTSHIETVCVLRR